MRSQVMGIVNVTEDSFSDGGRYLEPEKAVAHARALVAQGADIIDVGGESTRPGASRVDPDLELRRVVPVIQALSQEGIVTSVDTMRASVAAAAVEAGVSMINDVSGGLADPHMLEVMAEAGVPVCLMHWNTSRFGDAAGAADHGGDVVRDVHQRLDERIEAALAAGVRNEDIVLDPGLGFAKTAQDNWALLHALPSFVAREHRILLGASRKRFLAAIPQARGLEQNADPATAAVTAIAAHHGVWCVRVHDVAISRDAVDVAACWNTQGGLGG
ncbi:dihydropteroate synthase [Corynebacterium pseudopelargi]|uniref:Dihydropteroate synthase n=1 Tax=Corynebacterium pseudopelargi TaxID=2080757 RepID=A0A3G6IS64_9CORY|nr:dihydropteroate synthase [Corynebacterium pseudopelargi]AZA08449.1 Dihydropteroate synthase 1 [Corynebacterium pseudopelargi]